MPPNKNLLSVVTVVIATAVVSCVNAETLVGLQTDSQSNSLRHSPSQVFSTPLDSVNEPKGFSLQSSYGSSAEASGSYPSQQYAPSSSGNAASSSSSSSYESPLTPGSSSQGNGPYTYYYQHYPHGTTGGSGGGLEGHSDDHLGGFGGLAGLGGLGGIGGIGILAAAAKGILAIKPFLILGLLILIAIPILLLFLPIPIITISGQTGMVNGSAGRSSPSQGALSYLTTLSSKVLSSEECLERVLCKMPQAPETYKKKARQVWEAVEGHPFLQTKPRISRGLQAYFDPSLGTKNRNFKCNQRFRCSNKFL